MCEWNVCVWVRQREKAENERKKKKKKLTLLSAFCQAKKYVFDSELRICPSIIRLLILHSIGLSSSMHVAPFRSVSLSSSSSLCYHFVSWHRMRMNERREEMWNKKRMRFFFLFSYNFFIYFLMISFSLNDIFGFNILQKSFLSQTVFPFFSFSLCCSVQCNFDDKITIVSLHLRIAQSLLRLKRNASIFGMALISFWHQMVNSFPVQR